MARLNKKILCFVDEHGTAGDPGFALGCVLVWARKCGRADKAFSDVLPATVNEVHASRWRAGELQSLLARYAQTEAPDGLVMMNRLSDDGAGTRPEIYARALIATVKIGIKRFAKVNGLGGRVGNVEVIVDINHQNDLEEFRRLIDQARGEGGIFRAVTRVVPLDSAASRMLQLADVVAHSRAWITRGEEQAKGLRENYGIEVL